MPIQFTVTHSFSQPPSEVFEALTDLPGASAWMPNLVGIDLLTSGPFGVGTEWRETRKMFGKESTEQFEVTRCDPPTRVSIRVDGTKGDSKRGEYLFDYRLEPKGEGTEVVLDGTIRGLTGITALVGRLMTGPFRKACAKDLMALAAHLEKESPFIPNGRAGAAR